jgi:hypothetical protein
MRHWSLFPALHLYPSDTEQTYVRRVGMRGLRHKSRHKFSRCVRQPIQAAAQPGGAYFYFHLRREFSRIFSEFAGEYMCDRFP